MGNIDLYNTEVVGFLFKVQIGGGELALIRLVEKLSDDPVIFGIFSSEINPGVFRKKIKVILLSRNPFLFVFKLFKYRRHVWIGSLIYANFFLLILKGLRILPKVAVREGNNPLLAVKYERCFYKRILRRIFYLELIRRADLLIVMNECMRGLYLDLVNEKEKIVVVRQIVNRAELLILSNFPFDFVAHGIEKNRYFVFVGRLVEQKGILDFVTYVCSKVVALPMPLVIIGDGADKAAIDDMIVKYNRSDLFLLGQLDNPFPLVRNAHALLLTSRFEGCPNVIHEALALGTTVISSDCRCGPSELLPEANLFGVDDWSHCLSILRML